MKNIEVYLGKDASEEMDVTSTHYRERVLGEVLAKARVIPVFDCVNTVRVEVDVSGKCSYFIMGIKNRFAKRVVNGINGLEGHCAKAVPYIK